MIVRQSELAGNPFAETEQELSAGPALLENLSVPQLYEHALRRGEGRLGASGQLTVDTGEHTGRSPDDKFIVRRSRLTAIWWGSVNRPLAPEAFSVLLRDVERYLGERERFGQDLWACAAAGARLRIRLVAEQAWHALFARNLFIVPPPEAEDERGRDDAADARVVTILHAPGFIADPARHGVRSGTAVVLDPERRTIVIVGSRYAGEIKKSVFTLLQYLLPQHDVATMHCSANAGAGGDVALFFGLSGTGKTTLSTDPDRVLIGDDEHGWSQRGVFNFEGGCYAKVINLSAEAEPEIFAASRRFGTVLENVVLHTTTREPLWGDDTLTENTRAAYPLDFLQGASSDGVAGHATTVVFLSADAFGVLPPVARLTPDQALYWYLSGYTAKLAGTERGLEEPEATFSACFGAPFLPLPPERYADLLGEQLRQHRPQVWLVNTGWSGGPYGVGARMPIKVTRAIIAAVLDGGLARVPTEPDPIFDVAVPVACPGVPVELLRPRSTWTDAAAYDRSAQRLAKAFAANFEQFAPNVSAAVAASGPRPA